MVDRPEYDDPDRYAELAAFDGGYRDLWHDPGMLTMLAARLRLGAATEVLDVGCGAGHWGRTVITHVCPEATLVGVDHEPEFLTLAAQQAGVLQPRTEYIEAKAEALPFEDDRFDLVTCQTVLIHVRDAAAVVREMLRVVRPGGVVLLAEPDNRAGNLAQLGGEPRAPDEDVLAIVEFLLACDRGKRELGEGDSSVGARLPGILAAAGCDSVGALANPRCVHLHPPYDQPHMRVCIDQERAWAAEDVSVFCGARGDAARLHRAAGGDEAAFERGWAAVRRFEQDRFAAIDAGVHHAARGYVFYYAFGRKPVAS